jgi:hypothetical protein
MQACAPFEMAHALFLRFGSAGNPRPIHVEMSVRPQMAQPFNSTTCSSVSLQMFVMSIETMSQVVGVKPLQALCLERHCFCKYFVGCEPTASEFI